MVCVHLCRWDVLTGNLELVEEINGHTDIVYGSFDPTYFTRFLSKQDFLFSRSWRRDQDGSYCEIAFLHLIFVGIVRITMVESNTSISSQVSHLVCF
jgi:hypothetical protein